MKNKEYPSYNAGNKNGFDHMTREEKAVRLIQGEEIRKSIGEGFVAIHAEDLNFLANSVERYDPYHYYRVQFVFKNGRKHRPKWPLFFAMHYYVSAFLAGIPCVIKFKALDFSSKR